MVANPGFVDLNHLAHRLHTILVTHRLLLHLEEAANPESAKDTVRYRAWYFSAEPTVLVLALNGRSCTVFGVRTSKSPPLISSLMSNLWRSICTASSPLCFFFSHPLRRLPPRTCPPPFGRVSGARSSRF